jgi:hypothetical protein
VFLAVFTKDDDLLRSVSLNATNTKLSTILFTPTLVKRVIRKINGKAKGSPDDKPPLFFKQCCNQLSSPLAFVFNQCMNHAAVKSDCKSRT